MSLLDLAARAARLFPAETAHRLTIRALASGMVAPAPEMDDPRLAVTLPRSGLRLPNPVGLAAGFDKNAEAWAPMLALGFGFVECGTVTPRPQEGNPRPRLFRLEEDQAVINRMGFNNEGLGPFVRRLAGAPRAAMVIGANVGANKDSADRAADYVAGIKAVWPHCSYLTLNISSPNTPGLRGLQDRGALEDLLGRCGEAAVEMSRIGGRPLFLKVAPDLDPVAIEDIAAVAKTCAPLTGLIVSNTTLERPASLASRHAGETGGLSGRPLMARSTAVLSQFASALDGALDLIGAGGVASAEDVLAKFAAGAQAVQLYSALVYGGPGLVRRIKADLVAALDASGAASLNELARAQQG